MDNLTETKSEDIIKEIPNKMKHCNPNDKVEQRKSSKKLSATKVDNSASKNIVSKDNNEKIYKSINTRTKTRNNERSFQVEIS